jgi:hypothetical protein
MAFPLVAMAASTALSAMNGRRSSSAQRRARQAAQAYSNQLHDIRTGQSALTGEDIVYNAYKTQRAAEEAAAKRGLMYDPSNAQDFSGAIGEYIKGGGTESANIMNDLPSGMAWQNEQNRMRQNQADILASQQANPVYAGAMGRPDSTWNNVSIPGFQNPFTQEAGPLGTMRVTPNGGVSYGPNAVEAGHQANVDAIQGYNPANWNTGPVNYGHSAVAESIGAPLPSGAGPGPQQRSSAFQEQLAQIARGRDMALQSLDLGTAASDAAKQYGDTTASIQNSLQKPTWQRFLSDYAQQAVPAGANAAGAYGYETLFGNQTPESTMDFSSWGS